MKKFSKLLLGASFLALTLSFTGDTVNENGTTAIVCKYDQCHATAKSTGNRCKHCVSNEGDLYCWQHD